MYISLTRVQYLAIVMGFFCLFLLVTNRRNQKMVQKKMSLPIHLRRCFLSSDSSCHSVSFLFLRQTSRKDNSTPCLYFLTLTSLLPKSLPIAKSKKQFPHLTCFLAAVDSDNSNHDVHETKFSLGFPLCFDAPRVSPTDPPPCPLYMLVHLRTLSWALFSSHRGSICRKN